MHGCGRQSAATDGERWFVVAAMVPPNTWACLCQAERQRSIIALGDARMVITTGDVARHTGNRHTGAATQTRDNVFGQRKCKALSPGAKPTHFPETGGACQCGTGKGKEAMVTNHNPHTTVTSL